MENKKFFNNLTKDPAEMNLLEKFNYLKNHFRYWTANPWNRLDSYANNVKLYNLGLTDEQKDKAYDFWDIQDFYEEINLAIQVFNQDPEYKGNYIDPFLNGRNDGYIVAYRRNDSGKRLFHYDYTVYDDIKDFAQSESLRSDDVRYYIEDDFETLVDFDDFCDDIREIFIYMLENYEVEEEEVIYTKLVKTLVKKQ